MVPDLRMAMKVGADSMANEIRTNLETTRTSYFTASRRQKKIWGDMLELILHLLSLGCLFLVVWTWLCSRWHTALLLACKQRWPRHDSAWQSPPSAGQPHQPRQPRRFLRCHHGNHPNRPNRNWQLSRLVRKLSDCFQWDLFPYFFSTYSHINVDDVTILKWPTATHKFNFLVALYFIILSL